MTALPLKRPDGTIVAYTQVDAADIEWLSQWTWRLQTIGYAVRWGKTRRPNRKTICLPMHRVICGLETGDGLEVDHINGDKLDNRRANLRVCTRAENGQNLHITSGASRFRGVSIHGRYWRASARLGGTLHLLGDYENEIEAARVVDAFRAQHMPFAEPDPALWPVDKAAA